ncbi:MAG TPA: hypothetical protein VG276_28865 [Actinomycetes bacterium]|jgi:hypothetical protein|nr:hypothetical protein [Actinomycetes bacterium]
MASPWRDTTTHLPAGADRAAFDACPPVVSNGYVGPDPMELAVEAALEERYFDEGRDPGLALWGWLATRTDDPKDAA